jgi:hypothetical protein
MELKMMQPMGQAPTGLSEDEVALFSSRSAEGKGPCWNLADHSDEANQSRIQSFNPSEALHHSSALDSPSHHRAMPAPLAYVRRDLEMAVTDNMAKTHTSGPSSGHLSPTQLSAQAVPEPDFATISKRQNQDAQTIQQRTPLRSKASNQAFQLSSSPIEASSSSKKPTHTTSKHIDVLSDSEEIEVIETVRPTPGSKRRRPEILLQSKSASRARSRIDSPDPLDLIPSGSADTHSSNERHSVQPRSSATESTHVGTERKSSRVQAATERKELEKEEKRRLRRERKAREEADRIAKGNQEPTAKSKRQKSATPATAAKPITYSGNSTRSARQAAKVDRSSATPAPSASHISPVDSITQRPAQPRIAKGRASIDVATPSEEAEPEGPLSPVKVSEADAIIDEEPTPPELVAQKPPFPNEFLAKGDISKPKLHDARSESPLADPRRRELVASSSSSRQSPGPAGPDGRPQRPDGIRWQTSKSSS